MSRKPEVTLEAAKSLLTSLDGITEVSMGVGAGWVWKRRQHGAENHSRKVGCTRERKGPMLERDLGRRDMF